MGSVRNSRAELAARVVEAHSLSRRVADFVCVVKLGTTPLRRERAQRAGLEVMPEREYLEAIAAGAEHAAAHAQALADTLEAMKLECELMLGLHVADEPAAADCAAFVANVTRGQS